MSNSRSGADIIIPNTLEAFINNALDLTANVVYSSYTLPNTTLIVDDLFHLREGMAVFVDGVATALISISRSTRTIVVSGDFSGASTIRVPKPFFFHGTPYNTNTQLAYLDDASKVPMIYLMEVLTERQEGYATFGVRTSMRLFFLDVANVEDWTNDQHYSNVIQGQRSLIARFLDTFAINKRYFTNLYSSAITNHAKFGLYVNNKGHLNSLFNDRLSGVELVIDVHAAPCRIDPELPTQDGAFSSAFSSAFDV